MARNPELKKKVLVSLIDLDDITLPAVAKKSGVRKGTASVYLGQFVDEGILRRIRHGHYKLTDSGSKTAIKTERNSKEEGSSSRKIVLESGRWALKDQNMLIDFIKEYGAEEVVDEVNRLESLRKKFQK